ncbi:hypothetical protein [Roseomonas fluvialis]|uniref:DUF5666 domain-containing protein n=1 Tax=Roseomonas fluvialis TaxID=1750527 RepID=A0ABM7Y170_9PROT|nr:hypothetical protein [Roseomonas fluvialis]BDG71514.1 hypothetical protein Rmf_14430 [Roseomonas fluvialis]
MSDSVSRRSVLVAVPLLGGAFVQGCAAPPAPPPTPVVERIAAYGTVRAVTPSTRQVAVTTTSGALFDLTAGPEFRDLPRLRAGTQVVVAYGEDGTVRIVTLPLPAGVGGRPWLRGTIVAVEPGGALLRVTGLPEGNGVLSIPQAAMRAFATRLGPGDEVGVVLAAT